jgi:hypothetical protein
LLGSDDRLDLAGDTERVNCPAPMTTKRLSASSAALIEGSSVQSASAIARCASKMPIFYAERRYTRTVLAGVGGCVETLLNWWKLDMRSDI